MSEISRRKFIQLTVIGGATAAAGLASGCRPSEQERGQYGGYNDRVAPYVIQPEGMEDGVPQWFATTCRMCPAGCGIQVRTMGGRAHKIEGNPGHPVSHGKTCARGQAALQHLYNPDRLRFPQVRVGAGTLTQTDWDTGLNTLSDGLKSNLGRIAVLADAMILDYSPTLTRTLGEFAQKHGASITRFALLDDAPWRAAARAVYGRDQIPAYQLDQADCIVSFGGNFLEAWPSPVHYNWLFGDFRQGPRRAAGEHGRFIYVGPRMSMTAAKADEWLPCNPGTEGVVASGLLTALGGSGTPVAEAAAASGLTEDQIQRLARNFAAAGTRAVAVGGDGLISQPSAATAFTAVESLNRHVRSAIVGFGGFALTPPARSARGYLSELQTLRDSLIAGKIGAVVIVGQPNPLFTVPESFGLSEALGRAPFIAALTPFLDETSIKANVALPIRTFLEDWGDSIPSVPPAGVKMASLQQPIIEPRYVLTNDNGTDHAATAAPWMDTRPLGDLLARLTQRAGGAPRDADARGAVRRAWAEIGQATLSAPTTNDDPVWASALSTGGAWSSTPTPPAIPIHPQATSPPPAPAPIAPGSFALMLYPHLYWTDGRHANLSWLQEIPDPMTSAVWNNWVEINLQTAMKMEIRTGDIVRLTSAHGSIEVPALPTPGLHPGAVAMPIGQGHAANIYGRSAGGQGVNPMAIVDSAADAATGAYAYNATHVQIVKVRSAKDGYHKELNTLVLLQDRPGGQEPEAVKNLIHETATDWRKSGAVKGSS